MAEKRNKETTKTAEGPAKREIVIARTFDAPRELVFKAWTDAKMVARWWGPGGFDNPVCQWDARPGGAIYIVMRGPDGAEYPMKGVFQEVTPPERLVFSNAAVDKEGRILLEGLAEVSFAAHGEKTRLTLRASAVGLVPFAPQMLAGMEAGWTQSLGKLATVVEDTAEREFVNVRLFDAPRERVFKAWTDPELLAQWWGPQGFSSSFKEFQPKAGGAWRFTMHGPDGKDYPNESVFDELVEPQLICFRHLVAPEFQATASFSDMGGKTLLTWRVVFKTAELYGKVKGFAVKGNEECLDRLGALLEKSASGGLP